MRRMTVLRRLAARRGTGDGTNDQGVIGGQTSQVLSINTRRPFRAATRHRVQVRGAPGERALPGARCSVSARRPRGERHSAIPAWRVLSARLLDAWTRPCTALASRRCSRRGSTGPCGMGRLARGIVITATMPRDAQLKWADLVFGAYA